MTGGIYSHPSFYINKYGKHPCSHQIYVDEVEEWSGHRVRKLRTPKLLAKAREQFGCSSLTGVPLEDHPIGKDNHWEARVFGPEIMSYGHNSGESYLSDLTLAYLEDTGRYVANYSKAGRLTPHSGEFVDLAVVPLITSGDVEKKNDVSSNRTKLSPGYTRWGRHAGCDFVTGDPKKWPENYRCNEKNSGGCTQDNKMPGRCNLRKWGQGGYTARSKLRCEPDKSEAWGGGRTPSSTSWKCVTNDAGASIPTEYHHLCLLYTSDAADE